MGFPFVRLTFDKFLEPLDRGLVITLVLLDFHDFVVPHGLHLLLDFLLVDKFIKLDVLLFELCDEVEVLLFKLDDDLVLSLVLDDPLLLAALELELPRVDPRVVYFRHRHFHHW